ncbi:lipopolysaccharide heptosyltransferase II [Thermovibrio ammonificans HB-1]|uniref:lipopolysaccharide heptosyltransferase II n=1 Tax=Thermovibrio ammonificans (strain DSM 15698 / JCM 12110 / HB-1) TaxID=648996 RepID=E8T2E6_THEA1|nr:lipopolysaccharide heptosyltransferase II [Thermovibrio ammonificans]ADU97041.1 lipopolysaccharide heptosyltransferase II [Thermovibrio ammonificans HB-1]
MEKIVVFQTAFLGDLILTAPLLKSLKRTFPSGELHLVVRKGLETVFEGFWPVDRVIPFDKRGIWKFAQELRREKYTLAVSPHRSHRTSLILFLSGAKRRIGYDKAGFSFLYTDRVKHEFKEGLHEIDRQLRLLEPLEQEVEVTYDKEPELPVSQEEVERVKGKFSLKTPYAVLAPGSVWPTKAWLPEYYAEVANFLLKRGITPVLVGGKGDSTYCNRCFSFMEGGVNLCGRTDLKEFFAVVKGAKVVVSNDSSPVHVAVSVKTPVVEVYGPTVPAFGFFPYGRGNWVELELPCRPCGIHGGKRCPEGHFRCMKELKPEAVIEKVRELLSV